uniref:Putative GIY YIG homing endonuclease n=1 Tax=Stephanosphaera pluvialis TaxID=51712 RepID=A0A0S2IDH1_9CHLO|nr:putative GIY YIG homing endonuclease [Stephanosphaera pluvialis]
MAFRLHSSFQTTQNQLQQFLTFLIELKTRIKAFSPQSENSFETLFSKNKLKILRYTYRLKINNPTVLANNDPRRYYMGYRNCRTNPTVDEYWSSSDIIQTMIRAGVTFSKKVLGVFVKNPSALDAEVRYHAYLNVGNNPVFFNQANQTSTAFTYDNTGRVQTPESNAARSAALMGRPRNHSAAGLEAIANYQLYERVRSFEEIQTLSENARARNSEMTTCPFCGKSGQNVAFRRWHFDNCLHNPNCPTEALEIRRQLAEQARARNKQKSPKAGSNSQNPVEGQTTSPQAPEQS